MIWKIIGWLFGAVKVFIIVDVLIIIILLVLDAFTVRRNRNRKNAELDRQLRDPMPEYEERLYRQQLNPHSFNATKLVVCVVCGRPEVLHERESHPFVPWERSDGDDR
jgi:hypothetical protein